jgi:hypothetical protein
MTEFTIAIFNSWKIFKRLVNNSNMIQIYIYNFLFWKKIFIENFTVQLTQKNIRNKDEISKTVGKRTNVNQKKQRKDKFPTSASSNIPFDGSHTFENKEIQQNCYVCKQTNIKMKIKTHQIVLYPI